MASDKLSSLALRDEATQRELLRTLKEAGDLKQKDVAKIMDTARLRYDDEILIAEAVAWGHEDKVGQKGIMVLTHIDHKRAVIGRLREEGFLPIQSDNLQAPNGAMLYVRTSGDMMSGVAVDRLWIHEDCPSRVSEALYPCLRKHA